MKKNLRRFGMVLLAAFLLPACNTTPPVAATPTNDPQPVLTGAAQTAQARLTEMVQVTPSPLPPTPTETLEPTPEATPTVENSLDATPTLTATSPAPVRTGADNAVFVEDRTVPDGTDFAPGTEFVKTWRLMNMGSSTWTSSYSLVFISDDAMGGPDSVPVPIEVPPNQLLDISVDLVAPTAPGNYRGYWRMRNPAGTFFGDSIYVDIDVVGEGTPVATAAPTSTPGSGSSAVVSDVSISLENPTVSGACPHTYAITGRFTLSEGATVTYQLEAGSDTPGFQFTLPGAQTVTLGAGTHTQSFSLNLTNSGSGWVRLRITEPQDIASEQAAFALTCN